MSASPLPNAGPQATKPNPAPTQASLPKLLVAWGFLIALLGAAVVFRFETRLADTATVLYGATAVFMVVHFALAHVARTHPNRSIAASLWLTVPLLVAAMWVGHGMAETSTDRVLVIIGPLSFTNLYAMGLFSARDRAARLKEAS